MASATLKPLSQTFIGRGTGVSAKAAANVIKAEPEAEASAVVAK
jgi:hypothetical protein